MLSTNDVFPRPLKSRESIKMSSDQNNLTDDEKRLYDRSIRLWGLEAQQRIRSASILLVGLSGLNAEVAKNVVLAGVKRVVVLDDELLSDSDLSAVFLANESKVGQKVC
jgi:ubiquitin-like 1-activating enzyme E1 A